MCRSEKYVLVVLLLLAFGLRVYRLDSQEIWGDEAYSITIASYSLRQALSANVDTHPPLYPALLWGSIRLIGKSPFAVRFPSVVSGLLVVPVVYRLGEVASRRAGLWAAGLAAVSSFLVYYSQEARMYMLSALGVAGSMLTFWLLERRQRTGVSISGKLWGLYFFSSLVAVYSHYYAFAVLLAQGLFLLGGVLKGGRLSHLGSWIAVWMVMALCFLPWATEHRRFLEGKASARFAEWSAAKFGEISGRMLLAYGVGTTLPAGIRSWGWGVVVIALIGLGRLISKGSRRAVIYALGLLLCGFFFAWAVNPVMPFFQERYLLAYAPPFLLLVAVGLSNWGRAGYPVAASEALYILLLNGLSLWHYHSDPTFTKGQYGSLMAHIAGQAQPGDLILLNNPLQSSLFEYYQPEGMPYQLLPREALLDDERTEQLLRPITEGYRRAWLVEFGNLQEYDPTQRARAWLARNGYWAFYRDYLGASLSMFLLGAPMAAQHPVNANLGGEVLLREYSLATDDRGFLLLSLSWEALHPISRSYVVFVHLLGADGQLRAQMDGIPLARTFPTTMWVPRELIQDHYALRLPTDSTPGARYELRVGMYLWPEMLRLPVIENSQSVGDYVRLEWIKPTFRTLK